MTQNNESVGNDENIESVENDKKHVRTYYLGEIYQAFYYACKEMGDDWIEQHWKRFDHNLNPFPMD